MVGVEAGGGVAGVDEVGGVAGAVVAEPVRLVDGLDPELLLPGCCFAAVLTGRRSRVACTLQAASFRVTILRPCVVAGRRGD